MSDSAPLRPSFFIIGERKCGTSSLYRYLLMHPQVLPGARKEMQFFTRSEDEVERGFADYLRAFPTAGQREAHLQWPELDSAGILYEEEVRFPLEPGQRYITGEASADTFCDASPALVRRYLPDLRLLLVLREPAERAFSHHRMLRRFQDEGRPLERPIGDFAHDMREDLRRARDGERPLLLRPGVYVENLRRWLEVWPPEQLLVLFATDLEEPNRCRNVMARVEGHLQLPAHDYGEALRQRFNRAPLAQMPDDIRGELRAFYRGHDRALEDTLGEAVPWLACDRVPPLS